MAAPIRVWRLNISPATSIVPNQPIRNQGQVTQFYKNLFYIQERPGYIQELYFDIQAVYFDIQSICREKHRVTTSSYTKIVF